MTQPNQSELDNLVQILGKYHDAEPHRYLEAADIVACITANYTPNIELENLLAEAYHKGYIDGGIAGLQSPPKKLPRFEQ